MTLIIDTAPIGAAADLADRHHGPVAEILRAEARPPLVPAPVTAEIDHLLGRRLGERARRAFLDDLAAGRFQVCCLEASDYATVATLDRRYRDLRLGLADLSVVVLAARMETRRILTFDERHFRTVEPLQGGAFELLPADA